MCNSLVTYYQGPFLVINFSQLSVLDRMLEMQELLGLKPLLDLVTGLGFTGKD